MSVILGVLGVALVFGIAVFVHELGHYLMARMRGVGVEAFAIGMGPKIFAWKRGGTEYSLRWFPVGGFVKLHQMLREDAEAEAQAESHGEATAKEHVEVEGVIVTEKKPVSVGESVHADMVALYQKGFITKLLVFGGGVFFNYLTAIAAVALLYTIGFKQGVPPEAWVGEVKAPSVKDAGLVMDDRIIEVEGEAVQNIKEMLDSLKSAMEKKTTQDGVDLKVRRAGSAGEQIVAVKLPAPTDDIGAPYFKKEDPDFIASWEWEVKPVVGGVLPYRPAAKAGLKDGDLIVKVNDQSVDRWSQVSKLIRAHPDEAITIAVVRKDKPAPLTFPMVPEDDPNNPGTGVVGIQPGSADQEDVRLPFSKALMNAPIETTERLVFIAKSTFGTLYGAIKSRNVKALKRDVGGPLVIFNLTYNNAQKGFVYLLDWFINLNLILAIMNLLPVPVLDGGFILLSALEGIARRPVPSRVLNPIYTFFVLCFITLFVLVSYQDVLNIFVRP